ncbi:hypothetical protein CDL12_29005 [Handroanthus impetiginosus]|uniref:PLAT domain-containing protein n=1 Tax=Handroanthus impetiginosus TaxID=429701 RepID=A0A2G9FZM0_9LAMI|nr:hypothetical protein CDL12_29005 [Handroanthus impetiginosus]
MQTGSFIKAGKDSTISITLSDSNGKSGNLDIFIGRGPCIGAPICRLNVTSDGSGHHHGWFCDYIEVTSTGPHKACCLSMFYLVQWLADDAPPYQLSIVLDGCSQMARRENWPFVVRNPVKSV